MRDAVPKVVEIFHPALDVIPRGAWFVEYVDDVRRPHLVLSALPYEPEPEAEGEFRYDFARRRARTASVPYRTFDAFSRRLVGIDLYAVSSTHLRNSER